jgi:hypothetical protein
MTDHEIQDIGSGPRRSSGAFISQITLLIRCVANLRNVQPLLRKRQIHSFERIVSTPSRCPGDEDAFGGPRPASVPEFAHVELLPKQLVKQQGNKTNNPYGRPWVHATEQRSLLTPQ